ncbi:choline transport ATP-binding protein OpuBA [Holospora obtusa F1]|uniref:Choline transport ATP-binding protein OpuBA n=1 Tax=Holospora obtusa F1 TaxID=1399147 RepID=W6TIB6_HOLOB|nr:ATP-binding cassette domain-containing protein [Holospora obtusa]ETZ07760.1 choline transport ATP-binding protein OpuBA [Holospora obtusa F1]
MLTLENVDVILGKNGKLEKKILNKLNLNVKKGEFVVIIGENGAGKSTLLNVISGFVQIDSGKVMINKENVTHTSQRYRTQLVSKVMQDPKLGTMENMTLLENMAFAFKRGQTRGLTCFSNEYRIEIFKEKLKILNIGLEHRLQDLVKDLSGGQRQALSIIMAMLQKSDILLLDEITAALDPISTDFIMEQTHLIVKKQKLTCVMITHNMFHAIKYGDQLWVLKNGSLIKSYDKQEKTNMTAAKLSAEL